MEKYLNSLGVKLKFVNEEHISKSLKVFKRIFNTKNKRVIPPKSKKKRRNQHIEASFRAFKVKNNMRRCEMDLTEERKLAPEKVIFIFSKHRIEITHEQATLILDFLFRMADIAVKVYRNYEEG